MWSCECQCCNFSLKELLLHEGEKEIDFTAMGLLFTSHYFGLFILDHTGEGVLS